MKPAILIATWFGSGLIRPAPGSWGSLAALPFAYGLIALGGAPALLVAALALFPIGLWAAGRYAAVTGKADAGEVVVDEVVGQWLALLPVAAFAPAQPFYWLASFALFRLFDIMKPWPISWLDRNIGGGFGVMIDDVVAGVVAALLLWALS